MQEQHGDFVIMESTAEDGQFSVMNDSTGQIRRFATVAACRQFIGVEETPGPKWEAVPLGADGKPLADVATVTGNDEDAAREAAHSWFHFIGVFGIKDIQVTRK